MRGKYRTKHAPVSTLGAAHCDTTRPRATPTASRGIPGAGLEPARPCEHKILSLARLPISPSGYRPTACDLRPHSSHTLRDDANAKRERSGAPVSYCPTCFAANGESGKRDSNPRPQPWQGCALPTELFPRAPTTITGDGQDSSHRSRVGQAPRSSRAGQSRNPRACRANHRVCASSPANAASPPFPTALPSPSTNSPVMPPSSAARRNHVSVS